MMKKASMLHYLSLDLHLELHFSPKQFDGTSSESSSAEKVVWIIHGLPVTDCMTAASTGITHFESTGSTRA